MVWDHDTQVPLNDITTPPSLSLYRDAMVGKPERSAGAQPGPEDDQQRAGNSGTVELGTKGKKKGSPIRGREEVGGKKEWEHTIVSAALVGNARSCGRVASEAPDVPWITKKGLGDRPARFRSGESYRNDSEETREGVNVSLCL